MDKTYCTHEGDDKFLQYLGGVSVWKIPLASPRRGQNDIILINLKKKLGRVSLTSWQNPVMSSCEHGTELSNFIKVEEFLDKIGYCQLLMKDFALWNLL
jgi:hypothetical protein